MPRSDAMARIAQGVRPGVEARGLRHVRGEAQDGLGLTRVDRGHLMGNAWLEGTDWRRVLRSVVEVRVHEISTPSESKEVATIA